ncbi:MAG: hypothetical protein NZ527_04755 [Hydrogenobacter thermophilus]|nr:hypothetical protein [Hydrogenobacter thermophilus]
MDWLRELTDEELAKVLYGDLSIIYSLCGIDTLIKLCENLMGMNIYISSKPIREAMKLYVRKNFTGDNHKELALRLGVGQRYIYEILEKMKDDRDKD